MQGHCQRLCLKDQDKDQDLSGKDQDCGQDYLGPSGVLEAKTNIAEGEGRHGLRSESNTQ